MNIFDLFFLALVFVTAISLCVAAALALARRPEHSLRILRRIALGAALYFAVVIAVSFVAPRRTYHLGERQCFDDWCIAATSATQFGNSEVVGLRISSRARRVSQRERDLRIYLVDRNNNRYQSTAVPEETSLSTLLQPGASIDLIRTFTVPPPARELSLVITRGGFPIGWFIIGYDSWFRKPPLIRLPLRTNSL